MSFYYRCFKKRILLIRRITNSLITLALKSVQRDSFYSCQLIYYEYLNIYRLRISLKLSIINYRCKVNSYNFKSIKRINSFVIWIDLYCRLRFATKAARANLRHVRYQRNFGGACENAKHARIRLKCRSGHCIEWYYYCC